MTSSIEGYKVGYRKPPQEHRFRPGLSGNPKGRPKTRKTPQIDLDELLGDPVRANTNRGSVLMDPFEAQIRKQLEMAMKGNVPSIEYLLNLFIQHEAVVPPEGVRNLGYSLRRSGSPVKSQRIHPVGLKFFKSGAANERSWQFFWRARRSSRKSVCAGDVWEPQGASQGEEEQTNYRTTRRAGNACGENRWPN